MKMRKAMGLVTAAVCSVSMLSAVPVGAYSSEESASSYAMMLAKKTDKTTKTDTKKDADKTVTLFSDTFEKNAGGWHSRGGETVGITSKVYNKGKRALAVLKRTAAWNGAAKDLDEKTFVPGNEYSFSVNVMYKKGDATDTFCMKLQYTDSTGAVQYAPVAEGKASKGKWIKLENECYVIPEDAENMQLYVETAGSTNDFYIDNAVATGKKGAAKPSKKTDDTKPAAKQGDVWVNNADISWIDPDKPMVAICFDDGPVGTSKNSSSIRIQNAISDNGGHATFFYWGVTMNSKTEKEITRAQKLGHEIANHTNTHADLTKLTPEGIRKEVNTSAEKLKKITGQENFLLRPPYLAINADVRKNAGAPLITCAVDTQDWNNATAQQIIDKIKKGMEDGSLDNCIVLMHETYDSTAEAMEYLAPYMKKKGWQIVTVSELFKANGKDMYNGTVYRKS